MAGSRDPLRDLPEAPPVRDLEVAPVRVGSPRSGRAAGAAVAAIGAVIVAALVLAQVPAPPGLLVPPTGRPVSAAGDDGRPAGVVPRSASPVLVGVGGPRPSGISPRLSRDDLRDAVLDGSLEGRLVFVDGMIRATPVRCRGLAQGRGTCVDLAIRGLGLPVWTETPAAPWRGAAPSGAWLVTVARNGGLVYLGSLVPAEPLPDSVADLANRLRRGAPPTSAATLFEVPGWLVVDPPRACARHAPGATPCPAPPFLAADEPVAGADPGSSRGSEVDLAARVVGLDRVAGVTGGSYLLAPPEGCQPDRALGTCRLGARWTVVARYDPPASVRVLVP